MAYHGPVRLSLKGDRVVAARYVRAGRVLLWKLAQETNGASARRVHKFANGTVIEVQIAGRIRMIDIFVPIVPLRPAPLREMFVVWPRDLAHVDGLDAQYPQLLLHPEWQTFFYNGDVVGYDDFDGRKSVYAPTFPPGVRYYGNTDWESPSGERLSWYGPSAGAFADPYVQPRAQFGRYVFALGQVLLDVGAYNTDADETGGYYDALYVLGACYRTVDGVRWLYVMHAELYPVTAPPITPPAPTPPYWRINPVQTPVFSHADTTLHLCRYRLTNPPEAPPYARWKVVGGSREEVWTATLPYAVQPWRFNASGTFAASFGAAPDGFVAPAVFDQTEDNATSAYTPGPPHIRTPPSTSSRRYTLRVNDEGDGAALMTEDLTLPSGGGFAALLTDYRGDEEVRMDVGRGAPGLPSWAFAIRFDGRTLPLQTETLVPPISEAWYYEPQRVARTSRWLLHVDLRAGTVVTLRAEYKRDYGYNNLKFIQWPQETVNDPANPRMVVELWRKGVLVTELRTASPLPYPSVVPDQSNPYFYTNQPLLDLAVAPLFALYGSTVVAWVFADPDPVGRASRINFAFPGAAFGRSVWPSSVLYGGYGYSDPRDGAITWLTFSGGSLASFATNRTDHLGYISVLGVATIETEKRAYTALSLHDFSGYFAGNTPTGLTGASLHWVDRGALPELTGVTAAGTRYHPLGALGASPT